MIKHIFSDMDGTLLDSKGNVSSINAKGIKESKVPFTLVSARAPMEMLDAIEKLELTEPQIAFNGGLIFKKTKDSFKVLTDDPMELSEAVQIIDYIKSNYSNISYSCYDLNNWYAEKIDEGTEYESSITHQIPQILNLQTLFATDPLLYKVMLISYGDYSVQDLLDGLNTLNLRNVSMKQTGPNYLEITSKVAKKSKGIEYIQDLENLDKSELAAFGDGHNDLPMFDSVGISVVMENAMSEIKKYGQFITKTNDQDGVSYGIKEYLI